MIAFNAMMLVVDPAKNFFNRIQGSLNYPYFIEVLKIDLKLL